MGEIVTRRTKSAAERRTLSVPAWLMELLEDHLWRMERLQRLDALVFTAPDGSGLDYGNWRWRVWVPAREAVGLPDLQFHDLRRTAASALVAEGVDMKTAQTRLGHADARTTLGIYAQAIEKANRDAADRIGRRFRPTRQNTTNQ